MRIDATASINIDTKQRDQGEAMAEIGLMRQLTDKNGVKLLQRKFRGAIPFHRMQNFSATTSLIRHRHFNFDSWFGCVRCALCNFRLGVLVEGNGVIKPAVAQSQRKWPDDTCGCGACTEAANDERRTGAGKSGTDWTNCSAELPVCCDDHTNSCVSNQII